MRSARWLQLSTSTWTRTSRLASTFHQGPFFVLTVMLAMAGLNNGANIQLWSAGPTPISAMALCAGDAQQGKSRLTAAVCAMIAAADDKIAGIVQQMPPPENVNPEEWYQQKPKQFTVRTVGVQDFTTKNRLLGVLASGPRSRRLLT